jgi:signal transduction histidine kinase
VNFEGGIRIRASLPLALQILGLVGGALVIAQLATIGLTLLLPPPQPSPYSLADIAQELKGAKVPASGDRPLVRTVLAEPPSYRSQGWVVSPRARDELAGLVGASSDDVRLLFYLPPPAGMVGFPPQVRVKPAALTSFSGGGFGEDAQIVNVGFGPPPGAFPGPPAGAFPSGGPPNGGFPGGGFPGSGAGQALPGGFGPGGANGPTSSHARPPFGAGASGAGGPSGASWGGGRAPGWSAPGFAAPGDRAPPVGLPTRIFMTFPGLAPLIAAQAASDNGSPARSAPAPPPAQPEVAEPDLPAKTEKQGSLEPARTAQRAVSTPAPAPIQARSLVPDTDLSGLLAPAPLVAQKTGDGSGWILGAPAAGHHAAGVRSMAFVPGDFVAAVRLGPGRWVTVRPAPEPFPNRWQRRIFLWFATAMLLITPFAWLFARRLTGPLAEFAAAAERLGRDPAAAPANLTGPAEVGRAARAFNHMQARLKRFVDDRTAMVGAIGHDLRTPLARMRFRLERAPEGLKRGMLNDIQQMEDMLNSVLTFIRDASEPAVRQRIDLRSIIECAVEDAELVGGDVVLAPGPPVSVEVDPLAIRRVAANLIDNAVKYGGRAEVSLQSDGADVTVAVTDDGPGLDPSEIERVFLPFYRSDAARTMNLGGIGLGLSVSRSIARAHGGDVRLFNRDHGLGAQLTLPLATSAAVRLDPKRSLTPAGLDPAALAGACRRQG